jgi:drug/metabolite transporter (DMT)-like permease
VAAHACRRRERALLADRWPAVQHLRHWAWIKIATSVPVGVFSLSMLVIPVVGVISGMLFLGERPSWAEYVALVLVLASLFTVVLPARQSR